MLSTQVKFVTEGHTYEQTDNNKTEASTTYTIVLKILGCQHNLLSPFITQCRLLTLYHTIPTFNNPDKEAF